MRSYRKILSSKLDLCCIISIIHPSNEKLIFIDYPIYSSCPNSAASLLVHKSPREISEEDTIAVHRSFYITKIATVFNLIFYHLSKKHNNVIREMRVSIYNLSIN